jgi:hypothetical protein
MRLAPNASNRMSRRGDGGAYTDRRLDAISDVTLTSEETHG